MMSRIWLEVKVLWARLCGWRVIREDVFGDMIPEYAGPGEKLWIIASLVGGYDRPGLVMDGGTVVINGNIYGDWDMYRFDEQRALTGNCPER